MNPHHLSIVVPMYDEEENIDPFVERVHLALAEFDLPWELLLVDDGSGDRTLERLREARSRWGRHVRVVALRRNFGQTAAIQAGIDQAAGSLIAMLDGDLQNDPMDIPAMVRRLLDEGLDLVAGWRRNRKDGLWLRKLPSRIANRLIGRATGVRVHDYGCTLKVFRAEVLKGIRLYGEMHRFIPALLASRTSPRRIVEQEVAHHPRVAGSSKYNLSRTTRVIVDLLYVYYFLRFRARPGHFFGSIGLAFGAVGGTILAYLALLKLAFGESIGDRPLLLAGVLLVVVGVQLLTTGVLGESLARTYYEASNERTYVVADDDPPGEWHGNRT